MLRNNALFVLPFLAFTFAFSPPAQAWERTVKQVSNMHDAADETVTLPGAGILTRTRRGVEVSLHLTGLEDKVAYTAWWILFNRPHRCSGPCGLDDLVAGVGQGFFATGFVAGADGTANVYARLSEGRIPKGADRLSEFLGLDPRSETGLKDSFKAEIHLIAARSHGPIEAGIADAQLGTFDGNCGPAPEYGDPCFDLQAVAFPAVAGRGAPSHDDDD